MLDFRYHALSLVAVFLALTVGLLLGVAIGDKGLVSNAGHNVRQSLQRNVSEAKAESRELRNQIRTHERFESQAIPLLVDGRLQGMRVGLIGIGGLDNGVIGDVRDALKETGARLTTVAAIREPVPGELLGELPAASAGKSTSTTGTTGAAGTPASGTGGDPAEMQRLGKVVGLDFIRGGDFLKRISRTLLSSSSGTIGGLDAVVLVRQQPKLDGADRGAATAFENGLVEGLSSHSTPVVGAETTTTQPSQIGWFDEHDLPSVDNVDQAFGQAALVFALAGANGSFGVKSSAEDLLPKTANPTG